jgi:5-hydroxyisourate hydrolase
MSPITTHVLDTALGRPAQNLGLRLEVLEINQWRTLASRVTNQDGRVTDLLPDGALTPGRYRMVFETAAYHRAAGQPVFYPEVSILFEIDHVNDVTAHYHIPLLLSPFGYSTYRGS